MGELRDRLGMIHDMHRKAPLNDRERLLARWVLFGLGDGETDITNEIMSNPGWWGPKAVRVLQLLSEQGSNNA
jgi:hypothetical protein